MFPALRKIQPYAPEALANLIRAASRRDAHAFGLVVKVRGNTVINWMYADADTLKSIAALKGEVRFMQNDSPHFKKTLRELTLSLTENTPFLALMIRYGEKEAKNWEFVDLSFLRNLTV